VLQIRINSQQKLLFEAIILYISAVWHYTALNKRSKVLLYFPVKVTRYKVKK